MLVLGLVLLAAGVVLVLCGVFATGTEPTTTGDRIETHATFIGIEMSATTLFIVALVAAALIVVGLWFAKIGTRQGLKRRKEQRRLNELSEKLDRAEARRNEDENPGERS